MTGSEGATFTRPREVAIASWLMSLFTIAELAAYPPTVGIAEDTLLAVMLAALVPALSVFGIFSFWRGRNWARYLVLAMALLAIYSLADLPGAGRLETFVIVGEALLAIWLIYWLNTAEARSYFTRKSFPAVRTQAG